MHDALKSAIKYVDKRPIEGRILRIHDVKKFGLRWGMN
jgi:hypothetical protein